MESQVWARALALEPITDPTHKPHVYYGGSPSIFLDRVDTHASDTETANGDISDLNRVGASIGNP